METVYLMPSWFKGIDISLEIIFAVITFLVAFFSFRIYHLTGEKEHRNFAIGFSTISFSYLVWAFLNYFVVSEIQGGICVLRLQEILVVSSILIYFFMVLYSFGFFLVYNSTLNQRIFESSGLMFLIITLGLYFVCDKTIIFALFSTLFPLFISIHYFRTYLVNHKGSTFFLALAFILISLSSLLFEFAADNYIYYLIKHGLELISYSLIALILSITLKHGKKKK